MDRKEEAIASSPQNLKMSIYTPVFQKTKITASSPITSRQIDGEKLETMADFIFLGSKITADATAAMKLKDAPWKKTCDKTRKHI